MDLATRHPAADPAALEAALAWIAGSALERTRGLEALAALPPAAALDLVGLGEVAEPRAAEVRRLVVAALSADPFRAPARPLSPAARMAVAAGRELPSWLEAAERTPPAFERPDPLGSMGGVPGRRSGGTGVPARPVVLLARAGGLEALGGMFAGPPLLAPGPGDTLLAYAPGGRAALVRLESGGAEIVREVAIGKATAAAWHPKRGFLLLDPDGTLRAADGGAALAGVRLTLPSRIFVAGDAIYIHGRTDPRVRKVEADGRVRVAVDEPTSAVAMDESGRMVVLLRSPRRRARTPGGFGRTTGPPAYRLVRVGRAGPETIAATDGDGEVALVGDLAFHVCASNGQLTIADLAGGGIARLGCLAGAEDVTSLIASRRAIYLTTARSGHVRAYGPSPLVFAPPGAAAPAPPAPGADPAAIRVPAGITALARGFAVLEGGEVLRIDERAAFASGDPPILLGRTPRAVSATPEGGLLVVPNDGTPLLEVAPGGSVRPLGFSSAGVVAAARFGSKGLALATSDGVLVWIEIGRGILGELARPGLRALAPFGPDDLLAVHDEGLEWLMRPGLGEVLHRGGPAVRSIAGDEGGAVAASMTAVFAFGPDGARLAERRLAAPREPLVALLGPRSALVVPRGGTEGWVWTY